MKLKYLLTMDCDEQGYWDNSGCCRWHKKAYHERRMQEAISLAKKIKEEKRLKHLEEKKKQVEKERETIRQQELKKLEELKAKYEQGN